MFHQLLMPVGNSLALSFLTAALPVVVVVLLLGVFRRPAWHAALAGLIVGLLVAIGPWQMPVPLAMRSVLCGATFALWPVMWIVLNGLLLYNIAVHSRRFDAFRSWLIGNLPNDRRVVLVVVGFCFGALLEGVAGFGCPVAITAGRRSQAAQLKSSAVRRDQFVGRRHGKDDLAAEYCHWRRGDPAEGPGRRGFRPHLRAQHRADADARGAGAGAAISRPGNHSVSNASLDWRIGRPGDNAHRRRLPQSAARELWRRSRLKSSWRSDIDRWSSCLDAIGGISGT